MRRFIILFSTVLITTISGYSQEKPLNQNNPVREAWFSNMGFGMFVHWSYDVSLGMVISHSMVGASEDFLDKYINELPKYFNPTKFNPADWAKQAKQAGMKYVVFTTKHHNGFCMFDTQTTDYNIMNTPFGRDATGEVIEAFRKEGLATGIYYSPDDFYFLHQQGILISRRRPEALPSNNKELLEYISKQMRELMTNYGDIDIVFLDGIDQEGQTELAKICWEINPDVVVTRGAMETPEQNTPDEPIPSPWEACYTLGDQWQFRPTNENYKSARNVIEMLIEIRAKGGNLLLNFSPDANGEITRDQVGILNELALWMFINGESLQGIEAMTPIREGDIWFTRKRGANTVYAFITEADWPYGRRKNFTIKSILTTEDTEISVLGHNSVVLEYQPEVDPRPVFSQEPEGLNMSVMRAQRIYNDRKWPNPVVLKIENIEITK
ncbi:alpha-L-fucosidase [Bacteroidota bacterium]